LFGSVDLFGGWGGTGRVPAPAIGSVRFESKQSLYYLGLGLLAISVLVYQLLFRSRIGRDWNAIGSSVKLAGSIGINVVKNRMVNVLIGNFFIALAGAFYVAYSRVAMPSAFGFDFSVYILAFAIIGGLFHPIWGPILGAAVVTILSEWLRAIGEYERVVTPLILVVIIILLPMGILGGADGWGRSQVARLGARLRGKRQPAPEEAIVVDARSVDDGS
jgi:ABC-type branched-subunit amino acid transport system permease subunit